MSEKASSYQIGNVGDGAVVLQGEYLYNISVQVQSAKDAEALLHHLKTLGNRDYYGPLLRRLDPIVLVNRSHELKEISHFFCNATVNVLYVLGLPGIGKSTLIRGALEFRRADTAVVWINCEGLNAEQLLLEVNAGLGLETQDVLRNPRLRLAEKLTVVFGAITHPSILILDGFEALLDANGCYCSEGIAKVMETLVTLEHKAKVLVTTRRLPHDVGEGNSSIQILRLGGLSEKMADKLFQRSARLTLEQRKAVVPDEALKKLDGHPKFIELLATAIAELPAEQVLAGLLTTSDIGEYMVTQVLNQVNTVDLQVLRAAAVFRGAFTFDALNAVYKAFPDGAETINIPVRTLVRRALLEKTTQPQTAYYLHPLVRDAVPRETAQQAAVHAAAASWFLHGQIEIGDFKTWDEGLYHLRRAAELGRNETYFQPYHNFVFENEQQLSYIGLGRRLTNEYKVLDTLTENTWEKIIIRWALGVELWQLGENVEAMTLFQELAEVLTEMQQQSTEEDTLNYAEMLVLVKAKLGNALLGLGRIDEARQLASEIELIANECQDVQHKLRYGELRFQIAREAVEMSEMLRWAEESFHLAEQWFQESPSAQTRDAMAEAHFRLGVTYLRLGNSSEMLKHFAAQLRIKLEIGKITGVAAGLFNLGSSLLLLQSDLVAAGAMFITSKQIYLETQTVQPDRHEYIESIIQQFLSNQNNIEIGRKALATISEQLLPYYQLALEGRLGTGITQKKSKTMTWCQRVKLMWRRLWQHQN